MEAMSIVGIIAFSEVAPSVSEWEFRGSLPVVGPFFLSLTLVATRTGEESRA
jgi:hypothetical protein